MITDATTPAIQANDLSYRYGSRSALSGVSLTVNGGEIFGLLGPNGGGKSTLFKLLTTAMPVQSGSARVAGLDVAREFWKVRRKIGVVFQHPSLDKKLTVVENLKHHGRLYGMAASAARARIGELLDRFGLTERSHECVEKLSGGLARRVEIAKGILHDPAVLILDEPSSGLDPRARIEMWRCLKQVQAAGVAVLLTTHWMEEAARCDRIGILHEGKLAAAGKPEDLVREVDRETVILRSKEPHLLAERLQSDFGLPATIVADEVRVAKNGGFAIASEIAAKYGDLLESLTVARPSLEDVFVASTGTRFGDASSSEE